MQDFLHTLRWRDMLQDLTPGTALQLQKPTVGYIGFDPTAPSLHIGNLATLMLIKHFQSCGHKAIVVIGGATSMVGDPSGKDVERELLDDPVIQHNQECIRQQIDHILNPEAQQQGITLYNNLDWFKAMPLLRFLRKVGKHIPTSYILAKASVRDRLATGISYTEFTYQMLQAHDFYHLYKTHDVKLQMGGADQWGNITTGTELIRRKGGKAFGLTTPLVTKADGTKFGKTTTGNLWLDPDKTSPYTFYQFWYNCTDTDAARFMKTFTMYGEDTIATLLGKHAAAPHQRVLQQALAKDITSRVHTPKACAKALSVTAFLFGQNPHKALSDIPEALLPELMESIPQVTISRNDLEQAGSLAELVSKTSRGIICNSMTAARKLVHNRGLRINNVVVEESQKPSNLKCLKGGYLLVQKGKKHHYLIHVQ